MQAKGIDRNSLLVALLLHVLGFLSVALVLKPFPEKKIYTPDYIPAYSFTGKVPPFVAKTSANEANHEEPPTPKKSAVSQDVRDMFLHEQWEQPQQSILASSKQIIRDTENMQTMKDFENIEPMLMIGDTTGSSDPLIKILARSLSAHFKYPKLEDAFRITGRVIVSMVLHPEGNFTNVHIVQSSNNQDLDLAALYAVNSAPRAKGANRFLSQPKYFIVGFIFGGRR